MKRGIIRLVISSIRAGTGNVVSIVNFLKIAMQIELHTVAQRKNNVIT